MNVDTNTLVSISEVDQNFSKIAKLVDQYGSAVVLKDNAPKYLIIEFNQVDEVKMAMDEDVMKISNKVMARNKAIYEELSK